MVYSLSLLYSIQRQYQARGRESGEESQGHVCSKVGQTQVLKNKRQIWCEYLYISAPRLQDRSFLLIATPPEAQSCFIVKREKLE